LIDGFRPGPAAGLGRGATSDAARLRELALEAPVIDFVNGLFAEALNRRASDVHLEPFERRFVVRMRIDGQLVDMRAGPRADFDAVCSRIKLLSGMDIGERRLPQDGRQSIRVAGQELDLRVSTLPSAWGESLVLRLLGKSSRLQTLAELGLDADRAHRLVAMVEKPNGVVLVSGPTGSGKTTTIYRLLTHLHNGARKIVTIEDPIEFDLPGVVQVQARGDIGLTFAAGLRSILRQDPDVIMVGEIRDPETARIAIQAALTGHMVISTVHTNSALAAVARLKDLGVEGFLLADVVRGVVGQRLARRLCVHCTRPSDPVQAAIHERAAAEWGVATTEEPGRWAEPIGCERCAGTGYLGRFGLYEIADGDAALERCIRDGADEAAMERAARRRGFINLFEDGVAKARLGLTTLAEISRIAAPAETPLETA
jgi:general secretion pathway protein E